VLALSGSRAGLGRGLAELFLAHGWIVEGCSRGAGAITHERYAHERVDVARDHDVHVWIRGVARRRGRLDAVVANAGFVPVPVPVAGSDGGPLSQAFAVNTAGAAALLGAAARVMLRQRHGSMVAISSMATAVLQPGSAAYSASKAALEAWVKVLARELAPSGVRCNVVAPSLVDTEGLVQLGDRGRELATAALTVRRPLTVAEVGGVVEFLLSPVAGTLTGHVFYLGLVP
jgi:NAD(P)-dependent dehydrogenase (short-subunit alcohol dehydrogenase family)